MEVLKARLDEALGNLMQYAIQQLAAMPVVGELELTDP